nr:uncharacterized protein LOC116153894 [Camelus dromedarius]
MLFTSRLLPRQTPSSARPQPFVLGVKREREGRRAWRRPGRGGLGARRRSRESGLGGSHQTTPRHRAGHARRAATCRWPCRGQDRTRAPADVLVAAAASSLRAASRSACVPGGAAAAALRWVRAAHSPVASSGAAGTRRRGRRPHLLRRLLPGSRRRHPARTDAARAGGVTLEPGRRVPVWRRASPGRSPKSELRREWGPKTGIPQIGGVVARATHGPAPPRWDTPLLHLNLYQNILNPSYTPGGVISGEDKGEPGRLFPSWSLRSRKGLMGNYNAEPRESGHRGGLLEELMAKGTEGRA